jgi:phage shock protein B
MDNNEAAVCITALLMAPAVLWMLTRIGRGAKRPASAPETAQMQALMDVAQRMERRIDSLEMLLDSELPGWRSRSRVS